MPLAVSIRTDADDPCRRRSFSTSYPLRPGSMMSRTMRSTSDSSAMRRPVSPSCASRTSCPSLRRFSRRPRAMARSSSMIRMEAIGSRRRKDDAEGAALAQPAVQLDPSAVQLDDLLGDGQTEAGPFRPPGEEVVAAVEAVEDAFAIVGPHSGSVVLHLDGDVAARAAGAHADALVVSSVLHRVGQQI